MPRPAGSVIIGAEGMWYTYASRHTTVWLRRRIQSRMPENPSQALMPASTLFTRSSWSAPAVLAPLGVGCAIVACGVWLSLPELAVMRSARSTVDEVAAVTEVPETPVPGRAAVELTGLRESRLFGVADPAAKAGTPDDAGADRTDVVVGDAAPADLPPAALPVSVQGIVFDPGSASGRVIFGGAGGDMRSYRVGDSLPDGVIIRFIEARRVVVEQAGELKALALPSPHGGAPLIRDQPGAVELEGLAMPDESSYPDDSNDESDYDPDWVEPEYE